MNLPGYLRRRTTCGRFPYRLISGLLIVGVSAAPSHGQSDNVFENTTGNGEFGDAGNWTAALPAGFPDFGGNTVGITVALDTTITVEALVLGLGGLSSTNNFESTFSASDFGVDPGTFAFTSGATIAPGTGSFVFKLGVTGSSMTFNLSSGGHLTFNTDADVSFGGTTTISNGSGGSLKSDAHAVTFTGRVVSDAGGTLIATNGGVFNFDAGMTGNGVQEFQFGTDGKFNFNGGASTFDDNVTFTNAAGGEFNVNSGSVTFSGDVTSTTGGNFTVGGDGGTSGGIKFEGDFNATGSQDFNLQLGSITFEGVTRFNGGTITMAGSPVVGGDPAAINFVGEVVNGVDGGSAAADLVASRSVQWVFRNAYTYDGAQNFSGDETSSFLFKDYANAVDIELDSTDVFTVDGTSLIFERTVNVLEGTVVTANNGGSYEFQKAMASANGAQFLANNGSSFVFGLIDGSAITGEFNGTGNQGFFGDNDESFRFSDVDFKTNGAGGDTATFEDLSATMNSLALGDGYNLVLGGFNGADIQTGELDASESHLFTFNNNSTLTASDTVKFGDDATLTLAGDGELNATGSVTLGSGVTTFNFQPTAVASESIGLVLGSRAGQTSNTIKTGGNIAFVSTGASDDENAMATLAGNVELASGFDDLTITSDMKSGGELLLANGSLGSVEATLDVQSGKVVVSSTTAVGQDLTVSLAAETTLEFQPATTGTNVFNIGTLNGGGAVGTEAIVQSGTGVATADSTFQVNNGSYAGRIQDNPDGDTALNFAVSGAVSGDEFTLKDGGNGSYTGSTSVVNDGIFILQGTLDGTSSVAVNSGGMLTIDGGSLTTVGDDSGSMVIASGSTVNLESSANLLTAGGLTLGGAFNAKDSSASTITGAGLVQSGGVLTAENTAKMTFNGDDNSLNISLGGTVNALGSANITVKNNTLLGGALDLSGSSTFASDAFDISSGGVLTMTESASLNATGDFEVSGSGSITGPAKITANSLTVKDGGTLTFIYDEAGDSYPMATLTGGDLTVEEDGVLVGDAYFDLGATGKLSYAGEVFVGALGAETGLMQITQGDLVSQANGSLQFGLTYDEIAMAGSNALLTVDNGYADFTESSTIKLDVQGTSYIPTDVQFTILQANNFLLPTGLSQLVPESGRPSVTRSWISKTLTAGGKKNLNVQSPADYLGKDPETGDQVLTGDLAPTGDWLNSLIPDANADPDGVTGKMLGSFDAIQTSAAYESATRGLQPTTVVSLIHLAPQTQFFDVLRHEIQREAASSGAKSPVPLRLGNDSETLIMQSEEQEIASTVRRTSKPEFDYAVIGRAFGRSLQTPTQGNVIGFDGHEYGGFGGFAFDVSKGFIIGFDIGYSNISGDLNGGFGNESIGTLRGGPYMSYLHESGWFFDVALSGGWNHYSYTRQDPALPSSGSTSADGDGFQIDAMIGTGFRIPLGESFAVTPQASFLYSYVNSGTITEASSGGALNGLTVDPSDLNAMIGRLGADLAFTALPGLIFDVEAGWQGNYTLSSDYSATAPGGTSVPFLSVDSTNLSTAYYGVGVSWLATWSVGLNLRYSGRSGDGLQSNMIYGGVSVRF